MRLRPRTTISQRPFVETATAIIAATETMCRRGPRGNEPEIRPFADERPVEEGVDRSSMSSHSFETWLFEMPDSASPGPVRRPAGSRRRRSRLLQSPFPAPSLRSWAAPRTAGSTSQRQSLFGTRTAPANPRTLDVQTLHYVASARGGGGLELVSSSGPLLEAARFISCH
jgi:hypothetical protein